MQSKTDRSVANCGFPKEHSCGLMSELRTRTEGRFYEQSRVYLDTKRLYYNIYLQTLGSTICPTRRL